MNTKLSLENKKPPESVHIAHMVSLHPSTTSLRPLITVPTNINWVFSRFKKHPAALI